MSKKIKLIILIVIPRNNPTSSSMEGASNGVLSRNFEGGETDEI